MKRTIVLAAGVCLMLCCGACGTAEDKQGEMPTPTATEAPVETGAPAETAAPTETPVPVEEVEPELTQEEIWTQYEMLFNSIDTAKAYKGLEDTNPLITQCFGADPYAMVYGDRVYFYMTADTYERDATGALKENSYGKIKTIRVISTDDMVNFEDHGAINVGGSKSAATWAANSWAPAAAWKTIDGQDKFFLYFADSARGIGVLAAVFRKAKPPIREMPEWWSWVQI